MAINYIITMPRLQRALDTVIREFESEGIWTDRVYNKIDVYLTWWPASAYGWQFYGTSGNIVIPAISISRLVNQLGHDYKVSLTDVLRHEYAHGVAHCYPRLVRAKQFRAAFGDGHDSAAKKQEYDPNCFVTNYASTHPSEDFPENFMYYLKHKGKLPNRFQHPTIRKKWNFVKRLLKQISSGKLTW